jgi:molybdopterin/thiamine biosynthesis adenylyltransferase
MASIRPETEVDRTEAAITRLGGSLPFEHGRVAIEVGREAAASPVGQRLLVTLVNELARMKGVVSAIAVTGISGERVLPGVPVEGQDLEDGLTALVASLNTDESPFRAEIAFASGDDAVRVNVGGGPPADITVGADSWRALLGEYAREAAWDARAPYGAALAAALVAVEAFKLLLLRNGLADPQRHPAGDLAFSAFNHGVDSGAAVGPDVLELELHDVAVVGCGAGGSAALYVLAMQPGLRGDVALIEPGRHKLSNLNRYLMTTASDVQEQRHKLGSAANHLARFAPLLRPTLHPVTWEVLDARPWPLVLATVDTVPARWAIQRRAAAGAEILDAAVNDLLYGLVRVAPGGWCLECKHPYDPDYVLKERGARWGQGIETVRSWTRQNVAVSADMIARLAEVQSRDPAEYAGLEGIRFEDVPALTECGETTLRADAPSQAPVLPLATTPAGVMLAAEVAKHFIAPEAQLDNWLGHDLGRRPERPRVVFRPASKHCPRHK